MLSGDNFICCKVGRLCGAMVTNSPVISNLPLKHNESHNSIDYTICWKYVS